MVKEEKETLAEVGIPWPSWLPKALYVERRVHEAITMWDGDRMSYNDEELLLTVTRKDGSIETYPFELESIKK